MLVFRYLINSPRKIWTGCEHSGISVDIAIGSRQSFVSFKFKKYNFWEHQVMCTGDWWGFSGGLSTILRRLYVERQKYHEMHIGFSRISGALSLPPISPPWHPQPDRHLFFAPQSVNGAYFLHSPPCRKWNCDEIHFFWAADWKAQYSHLAHCGRPNFSQFDIWQLGERFSWRGKCCKKHC